MMRLAVVGLWVVFAVGCSTPPEDVEPPSRAAQIRVGDRFLVSANPQVSHCITNSRATVDITGWVRANTRIEAADIVAKVDSGVIGNVGVLLASDFSNAQAS